MAKTFNKEIKNLKVFAMPGTPSFQIARPEGKDKVIGKEKQSKYRTGVGMLLFLVKHSQPDIANCTRKLSKVLDGASEGAYKELMRSIKFILDTKEFGL